MFLFYGPVGLILPKGRFIAMFQSLFLYFQNDLWCKINTIEKFIINTEKAGVPLNLQKKSTRPLGLVYNTAAGGESQTSVPLLTRHGVTSLNNVSTKGK